MKIVVTYKWTSNPQDAEVRPDGTVDFSRARGAVSEYDPVAFEVARRLVDSVGGEVIGLCAGVASIDTSLARKAALSRGLDQLVLVADQALAGADSTRLAAVLAAAVRAIGDVDLVIAGESSMDLAEGQVALTLAAQLGWLGLAAVAGVTATDDDVSVERELATGRQVLSLTGPAVLAATSDAVTPRIPGMKEILAAARKPVRVLALDALDLAAGPVSTTVLSTSRPASGNRQQVLIDGADPEAAAADLVAALRKVGAL
ncbi:MAG: electron transfer flavoprotein beta subunit [Actinomycetota bacterium]|nr:electron transfer flavoprotein beta subunit [Actinomycetota bacterium]